MACSDNLSCLQSIEAYTIQTATTTAFMAGAGSPLLAPAGLAFFGLILSVCFIAGYSSKW